MSEYVSIKKDVLLKLEEHLPEIRDRFGIETLGIFGSVARGEDTPESDVDIFYKFDPERISYASYLDFYDFLENLLERKIELVALDSMPGRFRKAIDEDMIQTTIPMGAI